MRARIALVVVVFVCGCSSGDEGPEAAQPDASPPCANDAECANLCPAGEMTTIRGTVTMPNGIDPVDRALVYVPIEVTPLPDTVTCEACRQLRDRALVWTSTAPDGGFELGPIPTAADQRPGIYARVVVQKGRFRRIANVQIDQPCRVNEAAVADVSLPSRSRDADSAPRIAVANGDFDQMECVLARMGLHEDSFDIYNGQDLASPPGTAGRLPELLADLERMKSYSVIVINCADNHEEPEFLAQPELRANLRDYVAAGGRLYVTDWSYDYIEQVEAWSPLIDFAPSIDEDPAVPEAPSAATDGPADIEVRATLKDDGLRQWLAAVEAATGTPLTEDDGTVTVRGFAPGWARQLAVAPEVKVWAEGAVPIGEDRPVVPLTTSYDDQQCGRLFFSSYHTEGGGATELFPGYCSSEPLSPQERIMEYLLLEIGSCVEIDG